MLKNKYTACTHNEMRCRLVREHRSLIGAHNGTDGRWLCDKSVTSSWVLFVAHFFFLLYTYVLSLLSSSLYTIERAAIRDDVIAVRRTRKRPSRYVTKLAVDDPPDISYVYPPEQSSSKLRPSSTFNF